MKNLLKILAFVGFCGLTILSCGVTDTGLPFARLSDVYVYGEGIKIEWSLSGATEIGLSRYALFEGTGGPATLQWHKELTGEQMEAEKYYDTDNLEFGTLYFYRFDDGHGFSEDSYLVNFRPVPNTVTPNRRSE